VKIKLNQRTDIDAKIMDLCFKKYGLNIRKGTHTQINESTKIYNLDAFIPDTKNKLKIIHLINIGQIYVINNKIISSTKCKTLTFNIKNQLIHLGKDQK